LIGINLIPLDGYMNKNFNTAEILESVDLLLNDKTSKPQDKKANTKLDDPIAEKIIFDAEETLQHEKKDNKIVQEKKFKKEEKIDEILILKDEIE